MNVQITSFQDFTLVDIEGRLDTLTAAEFEKQIMTLLDSGRINLILDCSGLNYISSSGLRTFLVVQKKMKSQQGKFMICSLQQGIKEIFDISGFSSIFSVFPDKEAAAKG
jgi:anti-anti-sigma factor